MQIGAKLQWKTKRKYAKKIVILNFLRLHFNFFYWISINRAKYVPINFEKNAAPEISKINPPG